MRHRSAPAIRVGLALLACASTALIAGCGLGAGPGSKDASIAVTEDFGAKVIGSASQKKVPGAETEMSLLQHSFDVSTRYGGGFVEAIDGRSGNSSEFDWFYYVNGILAPKGAAVTPVHAGDHVWWDLHDWSENAGVPAVVGSYPEPFLNGVDGQRFPTLLDCAPDVKAACSAVARSLTKAGVKVAYQAIGGESEADTLAVLVGTWKDLQHVFATELIAAGPGQSGVYAQFVGSGGKVLELDNPKGQVVRTLRGAVGLVAATDQANQNDPTWLVTGSNASGVESAARAMTPAKLRYHFAVAVSGAKVIPIPESPGQ